MSRSEIRKTILHEIRKPFTLSDITKHFANQKNTDKGLVVQVLNELYQEDLLSYNKHQNVYAFCVK